MKHYLLFCSLFFSALWFPTVSLWGQTLEEERLSIQLTEAPFLTFVEAVEQQSSFRFYFDKLQTDSLQVTVKATNEKLSTILSQVLKETNFSFAVDYRKNVFITKGRAIQTQLPLNFYTLDTLNETESSVEKEVTFVDYYEEEASEENNAERLYEIGTKTNMIQAGNATIKGQVVDAKTGTPLMGASLFIKEPFIGASTNPLGYFSLTIPKGRHQLFITNIGMRDEQRKIIVFGDGQLNIEMKEGVESLKEVVVQSERDANITQLEMGLEKMDIKTIKNIPSALGEADVLRIILSLPGVSSVGEASTGFNVRGGTVDQNLILLDDAVIYNPTHLFGFFSSFNPDVLEGVELYKSSIPAEFGGRLSSVLDITTREGNKKKFAGSGGIGPITGRLTLEGPLLKDRSSFIVGVRANYSNWLLNTLDNPDYNNSNASFYDVNLGVNHEINKENILQLKGYLSRDEFRLNGDTTFNYQNQNVSLKWKKVFNDRLFGEFTAGISNYDYSIQSTNNSTNAFNLSFGIGQANLQADFNFFPTEKHAINFGISTIRYRVNAGKFLPNSPESLVIPENLESEQAQETAIYISDNFSFSDRLSLEAGLRYSIFNYLGPKSINEYAPNQPLNEFTLTETTQISNGEIAQTYHGPEFRMALRFALNTQSSLKLSYNNLRQYVHLLSNTTAISPTDIWKLSDTHLRPQLGSQLSLGYYRNLRRSTIETSMEVYMKRTRNFLDFKSGAVLIMNEAIEQDVLPTIGRSYGVELSIRKPTGKLNGWLSYTYSRSLLQANDPSAGEVINRGEWYPSNFDKPHDVTLVSNYRVSHRFSFSFNFTYSTGRPITLPLSAFNYGNSERVFYSDRNAFRIPDYYRADISMNIEGNHKVRKLAHSSWTIALYNLTGRRNAYSVYFVAEGGEINGYQLSIFGQPIPTVTYNFKF